MLSWMDTKSRQTALSASTAQLSNFSPAADGERIAVLLVGHGTRDQRGQQEFTELVARLSRARPDLLVGGGYLEIAQPSIGAAVDELVARGATQLVAIPLLLLAAGHAKQDVPEALELAGRRHPRLTMRLAGHLGLHPSLLQLSRRRRLASRPIGFDSGSDSLHPPTWGEVAVDAGQNADERVLLVVGRGSGDHAAQAELREFARLSGELCGERHVRTCFLAMARPSLDERIAELEQSRYRRIVVQPHILFQGDLLERVQTRIRVAAESDRQRTWYLAEHLGPEDELLDTILARGAEVLTGLLPGLLPATTTYL